MEIHPHFYNSAQICPTLKHYRKRVIGGQLHMRSHPRSASASFHGSACGSVRGPAGNLLREKRFGLL